MRNIYKKKIEDEHAKQHFENSPPENTSHKNEKKKPMCWLTAVFSFLNSQHVFRHLPSVLQLMSSGKVVFYVSAKNINISAKDEERNIHIYFSFTAGVEFCRC